MAKSIWFVAATLLGLTAGAADAQQKCNPKCPPPQRQAPQRQAPPPRMAPPPRQMQPMQRPMPQMQRPMPQAQPQRAYPNYPNGARANPYGQGQRPYPGNPNGNRPNPYGAGQRVGGAPATGAGAYGQPNATRQQPYPGARPGYPRPAPGGNPAPGPRRFGSPNGARPPYAGRPNNGFQGRPEGDRRFGSNQRGFVGGRSRGYRSGLGAPRRAISGRGYFYHGHTYHPFVVGRYRYPRGYYYRHYDVGYRLPFIFLMPDFFIYDYDDYGVAPPPPGYQWVRYGTDMLLVDTGTGQVVDAVYGAFQESDDVQDMPPDEGPPPDAPYPDDDPNAPPPPQ